MTKYEITLIVPQLKYNIRDLSCNGKFSVSVNLPLIVTRNPLKKNCPRNFLQSLRLSSLSESPEIVFLNNFIRVHYIFIHNNNSITDDIN